MVKRTSLSKADCPVARSLDAIGDWWSLLIVRDAFDGLRRFGQFQESLGISKGILAARLHDLVELDILRVAPVEGAAYQEYVLTDKGRDLFPVVVALRQWGEDHCFGAGEHHSTLLESATRQPVGRLKVHARDGRELGWKDTVVRKIEPSRANRTAARPKRGQR